MAFDIECENMWSRDLGSLLLASNGDSGILHNCWCLECCFSVRSTFPQLAMMEIQKIFNELITICPSSIHIKIIIKLLKLRCRTALQRRWLLWKRLVLSRTCLWLPLPEWVKLFPVMFHINETYLNFPFYWYQYWNVCAIDKKCRWRFIPVDFTSPFCTWLKKKQNILIIT